MRHLLSILFTLILAAGCAPLAPGQGRAAIDPLSARHALRPAGESCTVLYAFDGQVALGGNNEDYRHPYTQAWFLPPEGGQYGRVYFGFENYIWQGGMNDQGLFFDALAVDQSVRVPRNDKPVYPGSLPDKALAECATVDCVVQLFERYHAYDTWRHQFFFGDATGESAIIEPLAVLRKEGAYQVATNFYQSTTPPQSRTCDRYRTATQMLQDASDFSVDLVRDILDAVHMEATVYSNVYDLTHRVVYLYFLGDYDHVVVLDLEQELAQGARTLDLPALFPDNEAAMAWREPIVQRLEATRAARPAVEVDPQRYQAYVGQYRVPAEMGVSYTHFAIDSDGERLILKIMPDKGWYELTPESETRFYHLSTYDDFSVTFVLDESGQATQFMYETSAGTYTFVRAGAEPEPATAAPTQLATPTATPVPPTATTVPPTATPLPPTVAPLPPTDTPVPPTATLAPPTATTAPPTAAPTPHAVGPEQPTRDVRWLWWALPALALVALGVWLGVRKRKGHK